MDTGSLDAMKDQTEQERSDPVEDIATEDARKGGEALRADTAGSMGAFRSRT